MSASLTDDRARVEEDRRGVPALLLGSGTLCMEQAMSVSWSGLLEMRALHHCIQVSHYSLK